MAARGAALSPAAARLAKPRGGTRTRRPPQRPFQKSGSPATHQLLVTGSKRQISV